MENPQTATQVCHEIAGVLACFTCLADVFDIDLVAALQEKNSANRDAIEEVLGCSLQSPRRSSPRLMPLTRG
jgi:hypothetical protein